MIMQKFIRLWPLASSESSVRTGVVIGGMLILANFLWFGLDSIDSHFAPDEMMNLYGAWDAGFQKILTHLILVHDYFYRPTGALYYWSLYKLFGLDPVPYRIFDMLVLAGNLALAYRLARALGCQRHVALLSVLFFSYHERIMIWAMYNGAWTYDRLCFSFMIGTILLYHRARTRPSPGGMLYYLAAFCAFLLALGAKEMAATIPLLIVALEAIFWRAPPGSESRLVIYRSGHDGNRSVDSG
jgi:hypothetical protein